MLEYAIKFSFKFRFMFVSYLQNWVLSVQACISDSCSLEGAVE
jgi:hypothetical protein